MTIILEPVQAHGSAVEAGGSPDISMVIPTRNEAGNIAELVDRLEAVAPDVSMEIIFVDDSTDDTPAVIEATGRGSRRPVVLVHRSEGERTGGLGGAVVAGIRKARGTWICVMDADLQHPPEVVANLFETASRDRADLVLASRFCESAEERGLSALRQLASKCTTAAARVLFPLRLRGVSDPMSGFFLVRRAALTVDELRPEGFKILLEILVRTRHLRRAEVGFEFGERHAGQSKASLVEGMRYLRHILRLWSSLRLGAAVRFGVTGLTGLAVNQLLLAVLVEAAGVFYLAASVVATQGSTTWNFVLSDRWVFRHQRAGRVWQRYLPFAAVNNAALVLRAPVLVILIEWLGLHYLAANFATLAAIFAIRFAVADRVIWRAPRPGGSDAAPASNATPALPPHVHVRIDLTSAGPRPATRHHAGRFRYDIGGLLCIASDVELRELAAMKAAPAGAGDPDVLVTRGGPGRLAPRRGITVTHAPGFVSYEEQLGSLGSNFAIDARRGSTVISVGPLLAASPHVLYTNVVEPVLRFELAARGHVLAHAGAVAVGGRATLIAAAPDTGKTTTVLRLVNQWGLRFLADDLVIVSADGRIRAYPKRLNAGRATLAAAGVRVGAARRLSVAARGRVHSSGGREAGRKLAARNVPIMACNAALQRVVPPPKFDAEQVLPRGAIGAVAQLGEVVFVERGEERIEPVAAADAVDALLANSCDAYDFPPFSYFAPSLRIGGLGYAEVLVREREVIAAALLGCSVTRMVSNRFAWAEAIAGPMPTAGAAAETSAVLVPAPAVGFTVG